MKKQLFNVLVVLVAVIIFYACSLPTTEHAKPDATSNDVQLSTTAQNPHVYKLVKLPLSWEEAKAYCESMGGYLACINSQEEQNYIYDSVIVPGGSPACWIGGINTNNDAIWEWLDGTKLDSYTNWADGEPNNGGGTGDEDHLATLPNGKWFDGDGNAGRFYFICEWNSEADIKESAKHVYKYISKAMTWAAAKTYCERMGGYLACVTSQTEQEYIYHNYLAPNGTPLSWGGASDYKKEDKWEWVSGEKWDYTKWYPGEPDNSGGQDFMFFNSGNTWSDGGYGLLPFVCEWNKEADIKEATEHIYKYIPTKMTWEEAKAYCESVGGYLVSVTSQEEQNLVYTNVLAPNGNPNCWMGASDGEKEGDWKWANGEGFYYSNWSKNEPNNYGGDEDYAFFYSDGSWNDGGKGRLPFICEWNSKEDILNPTGHVYEYIPKAMTWAAAKTYCESRGGYLVSVTTQIEQEYIFENYLVPNGSPLCWGGASDYKNENHWQWVSGEKWEYEKWMKGEPDNSNNQDFMFFNSGNTWSDGAYGLLPFVCEWNSKDDIKEYTDHVYKYISEKMTWAEAKAYCERIGGYLVSVNSSEEQYKIYNNYLIPNGTPECWLGASDEEKENNWKWTSGEDCYYSNWSRGEPSNSAGIENYVSFYPDGSWNDVAEKNLPFICEWNSQAEVKLNPEGHVYKYISEPMTWAAAKSYCESRGGYLASITSQVEQEYIYQNVMVSNGSPECWGGANDYKKEDDWQWVSGEKWKYSNWNFGEPNNSGDGENFMLLYSNGSWNDGGMGILPFICEWNSKDDIKEPTKHIYKYFSTEMTWEEAKAYCEKIGGYLVSVSSQEEQNTIYKDVLVPNGSPLCWMGASDTETEGTWKWASGEDRYYANWSKGEPNNYGGDEDYAFFYSDGTWNDGGNGKLPFICEWNSEKDIDTNTNFHGAEWHLVDGDLGVQRRSNWWDSLEDQWKRAFKYKVLWLSKNTNKPSDEKIKEIFNRKEISLGDFSLSNLSGLKHLTNLTSIWCYNNKLTSLVGLENLTNLTTLWCHNNQLTSLSGIENLTNLTYLHCGNNNQLTSLSGIENLTNLTTLWCHNNQLTSLTGIENCTKLSELDCSHNQLTILTGLENCTNLTYLACYSNQLTSLTELENCTNLYSLYCDGNQLTNLTALENCTNLNKLECYRNQLTSLTGLENCTNLRFLKCHDNQITSLEGIENCTFLRFLYCYSNQLTNLKGLDNCTILDFLQCSDNRLTSLEKLENCTKLRVLDCNANQLTSLTGLENCTNLNTLYCYNNQLTSLVGLEKCTNLNTLYCYNNQLTSLVGLEKCTNLNTLSCSYNKLTSLVGLEKCTNLTWLYCYNNQISSEEVARIKAIFPSCRIYNTN